MPSADDPPLHHFHDVYGQQPLSPRQGLPITPPEVDDDRALANPTGDVAEDLDSLVRELNRKPIFQDSLRWRFLHNKRGDEETEETEETEDIESEKVYAFEGSNLSSTQMPMQLQPSEATPALDPIPELSIQCDPCPLAIPPPCDPPRPPGLYHANGLVLDAPSEGKPPSRAHDAKRLRRGTETRLHKSASNLRMLGLMTGMIENGVQCKVQTSTPPSPSKTPSTSSALPASMRHIEPEDPIDPHLLSGPMQLEVDVGFGEPDEETLLTDNLALRHAGTPAGIRKFGFLRYRSSSEAAQSCKNMKKSVPRMRRRRRTSPTPASGSSASQKPPSTAA